MANIHLILQGKGGVGKSLISSLMMQYFSDKKKMIAVDTDPVNASLSSYQSFKVERIELLDESKTLVNMVMFDKLMEIIMESSEHDFIIDNGASSFIVLSQYLVENQVVSLLKEMGHIVIVHTIITGGQAMLDTMHGFSSLASNMDVNIVVWLNEFFGEVIMNGKGFEDFASYREHQHKVLSIVKLKKLSPLFEDDFKHMIEQHLTFNEAMKHNGISFMAKNRLKIIKKDIDAQLDIMRDAINLVESGIYDE